ncbi:putative WRKY transcription factor 19 [Dichanthelium oligosanthes]|uniref:Putative WRKY transcription factor 19 n=1 Tax=Dichanthelium oligosanthes TaxID=888268 RepID=A0A1E5VM93_9POAL|nr:putative WRKY transcription factor 19 [Dichanthelium oligosanthes]
MGDAGVRVLGSHDASRPFHLALRRAALQPSCRAPCLVPPPAREIERARNRCQQPGCNEVVDGRVLFCKVHSRGLSCQQYSNLQSAQESSGLLVSPVNEGQFNGPVSSSVTRTEQEIHIKHEVADRGKLKDSFGNTQGQTTQLVFHGAGMLCKHENCCKQAQENSICCKLHSGVNKGCMVRGCTRGAHGGTSLCIGHGGGKRCVIPGCPNAACGQGRSDCCVRHGGGKRCKFEGCAKGAQGNTDYCIRHGGGRRCKFEACTKSAQGRTDFCIKHGGGSRCKFQGCGTSAKWGTDFCSVHRKRLSGDNAIPEALLASSEKRRRAKKPKKAIKPSEPSQENVTTAAIAGSSTQQMGVFLIATPVPNHDMLTKGVKAIAPPQIVAPLSMKTPTPSGSVASAERETGASRAMLGL